MTSSKAYSRRSSAIRGKTREHIARLRDERLQKKRRSESADTVAVAASEQPISTGHAFTIEPTIPSQPDSAAAVDQAAGTLPADPTPDAATGSAANPTAAAAPDPVESPAPDTVEDAPGENESPEVVADTKPEACDDPEPALGSDEAADPFETAAQDAGEAVGTVAPAAEAEDAAENISAPEPSPKPDSDLFELPGAGSGLVWMFENCGIDTLRDLSMADAETLKQDLGLVAKILDVEYCIKFAKERSETA